MISNGANAPGTAADAATAWDNRMPEPAVAARPITQSPTTSRSNPNRTPVVTLEALKMNRHPLGNRSSCSPSEPSIEGFEGRRSVRREASDRTPEVAKQLRRQRPGGDRVDERRDDELVDRLAGEAAGL